MRTDSSQLAQHIDSLLVSAMHCFKQQQVLIKCKVQLHCLTAGDLGVLKQVKIELDQAQYFLITTREGQVDGARERNGKGLERAYPYRQGVVGVGSKQTAGELSHVEDAEVTECE